MPKSVSHSQTLLIQDISTQKPHRSVSKCKKRCKILLLENTIFKIILNALEQALSKVKWQSV